MTRGTITSEEKKYYEGLMAEANRDTANNIVSSVWDRVQRPVGEDEAMALYGGAGFTVEEQMSLLEAAEYDDASVSVWAWSGHVTRQRRGWALMAQQDFLTGEASEFEELKWFRRKSDAVAARELLAAGGSSHVSELPPIKFYVVLEWRAVEEHNGVHWDTCSADCNVAHGNIEIAARPVVDSIEAEHIRDDGKTDPMTEQFAYVVGAGGRWNPFQ